MSTTLRQTLLGTYEYAPDLFSELTLPENFSKDDFIDALILDQGEKGVIYSNPNYFKWAIGAWGRKWSHEFERIRRTLLEDYNPLHNFDRHEEYTDNTEYGEGTTYSNIGGGSDNRTFTSTSDGTITRERLTDEITKRDVSAFNASTYSPDEQTTVSGGKNQDTTREGNYTDNRSLTDSESGSAQKTSGTDLTHDGHLYGNIGVTTSQSMAKDEIALRVSNNLYGIMSKMFANEFLINIF